MPLKNCPFCGNQPIVHVWTKVTTIACKCHGNPYVYDEKPEKAEVLWNKRWYPVKKDEKAA